MAMIEQDPRVHFLQSLSSLIDELRETGYASNLTDVTRLAASIGAAYSMRDIVGARQYDVRWSVLRRSAHFESLANALAIYASGSQNAADVAEAIKTGTKVDYLEVLANSGLLFLQERKMETGQPLSILLPALIQERIGLNADYSVRDIEIPKILENTDEHENGES